MKDSSLLASALAAALALGVGFVLRARLAPDAGGGPRPRPGLRLVAREGRPWLLWAGDTPRAVEFRMENRSRFEVIGLAKDPATSHVVELAGWLGDGPVTIHALPVGGGSAQILPLGLGDVAPFLDGWARDILARDDEAAWRRLGRFSALYFTTPVGDAETRRRLQAHLVEKGPAAGPGGAAWLWGPAAAPARRSGLPGAPRVLAPEARPRSAGPGDPPVVVTLPPVETEAAELELHLEVSPTPAGNFAVVATLAGGWKARLEPGPEGGRCFQRVDPRALDPRGTRAEFAVVPGEGAAPGLRVSVVEAGVRYLPTKPAAAATGGT